MRFGPDSGRSAVPDRAVRDVNIHMKSGDLPHFGSISPRFSASFAKSLRTGLMFEGVGDSFTAVGMTAATEGFALTGFVHPLNEVRDATPLGLIQDFVSAASKVSAMAELKQLVGDASQGLGFDYYAMVQHVRFGVPSRHVRLTNYPLE